MLHGAGPGEGEPVDARAEARQHHGEQGQRGGDHEADREQDADHARAERLTGNEHDRGERGEHGEPAHEHRGAGAVHRLGDGVDRFQPLAERRAETHDDKERVVDAHREGEHQGEVHRPDRDAGELRADPQRAGGGHESEDGQQQRDPGRRERTEREREHGQCQRPRQHLGAQHRGLVVLVELRPERGRASQRHLGTRRGGALELRTEARGGANHLVGACRRAAADDGDRSLRGDPHGAHGGIAP